MIRLAQVILITGLLAELGYFLTALLVQAVL